MPNRDSTDWTQRVMLVCRAHLSPYDRPGVVPLENLRDARCEACGEPAIEAVVVAVPAAVGPVGVKTLRRPGSPLRGMGS